MGILDELSSSTGDTGSNLELVEKCLKTPALLHSVAEGLRTGTPKARVDCAEVLNIVAERRPDLLGEFVADFLDASKSSNKAVAKLGLEGLVRIINARPAEVYAERDYLLEVAKQSDAVGLGALAVLAVLCGNNPNYRGKLLASVVRLQAGVADKDLPRWLNTLAPAIEGSVDAYKRLALAVAPRRAALPEEIAKKVDKALLKIERSTVKK
jgi:hypothetical protein